MVIANILEWLFLYGMIFGAFIILFIESIIVAIIYLIKFIKKHKRR